MYFTGTKKAVDDQVFEAWRTSCLTLLRSTFGTSSPHYDSFINLKFFDHYNSTLIYIGILQGAREDLRKGYFFNKDLMLSVNIFSAFLVRARVYWQNGEDQKALGLLESVLQEAMCKLTESHGLLMPGSRDIGCMASALLRAGFITQETHDRVRELATRLAGAVETAPESFAQWIGWTQKIIYDHLGIRIIIEN